jgi:hypothetical protein
VETERSWKAGFIGRLRVYLLSVAMGLVLVGLLNMARSREAAARNAAAERQLNEPAAPGLFPPLPPAERAK